MTKSELRKIYLQKMRSFSPDERAAKSRAIADLSLQMLPLDRSKVVHCFIAIDKFNEIDTAFIFRRLWNEFPRILTVVPRVDMETGEILSLKFTPDTELVKNIWGIDEPGHDEYIKADEVDIVIVPLLCFDRRLHRVGYGKGFYDRFLKQCRPDCRKVGLSYFSPVERIDDIYEGDIALDMCITPDGVFEPSAM
jgi:5-formyltetrahydrofolate cyclo-ligase